MSTTDLQKQFYTRIEKELFDLNLPDHPVTLYEPFEYALKAGGKRIRPIFTMLACGICKGNIEESIPAALAVEILHNFTLVHDDIMDSADTRRGKPSVFNKWNENVAILSGDVMFAGAMQQLVYYGHNDAFSKEEFSALYDVFLKAIITVCEGQALDMEFVDRQNIELQEYIEMISGKTAALLSGSLEMGAIVAHSSKLQRQELDLIGKEIGIAFQIQDDLLDAIADPEKFGKKPGGDIFEGKKTYLTILALERANKKESELITETLFSNHPSLESVEAVLKLMKDLNVIKDVSSEIELRYQKAFELLSHFPSSEYKEELKNLLTFLRYRDH
ncbi:MAG: polyprenyl synthetase family protein [Balneolaceae bacterium]